MDIPSLIDKLEKLIEKGVDFFSDSIVGGTALLFIILIGGLIYISNYAKK